MSDYETTTHKACTVSELIKSLSSDNSLMAHKIESDGLISKNGVMVSNCEADNSINACKYGPAIAVKVLSKPPAMSALEKKLATLNGTLARLEGNGGIDHILRYSLSSDENFYESGYYKESVFQDVIERVKKEKSATKSCGMCGHKHNTSPQNSNIYPQGCNNCKDQFFLFTAADRKKHATALKKLVAVKQSIKEIEGQRKEKLEKALGARNWSWFIAAGTKAIASRREYDD